MNPQYYGAAAEYNKPKGHKLLSGKILIIGAGVLIFFVLFLVLFTILGAIAGGPRNDLARLSARADDLKSFIDKNQQTIHSPALQKISAETSLFIGTNQQALSKAYGGPIPDNIAASEADTTSAGELTDATQAGKFDETYLSILKEKIAGILQLSQKIQESGGSQTKAAGAATTSSMTTVNEELESIQL